MHEHTGRAGLTHTHTHTHTGTHKQPLQHWCVSLLSVCSAGHMDCQAFIALLSISEKWWQGQVLVFTACALLYSTLLTRNKNQSEGKGRQGNSQMVENATSTKSSGMFVFLLCSKLRRVKRITKNLHVVWGMKPAERTKFNLNTELKDWSCRVFAVCYLVISYKSENNILILTAY